jgi:hypothetical protein
LKRQHYPIANYPIINALGCYTDFMTILGPPPKAERWLNRVWMLWVIAGLIGAAYYGLNR